jgi:hypothetical protein
MDRTLSKRLSGTLLIAGLVAFMPLSAFADREHHRHHHEKDHDRDDRDHDRDRHERDHSRRQPSTVVSFGLHVNSAPPVRYSACPEPVGYYAPRVYYYDPYCGRRFATFELYVQHVGCRRHPGYVRVRDWDDDDELYAYRRAPQGWVRCRF